MASEPSEEQRRVHCRRVDGLRTVEEHLGCPYCHGKRREVEGGEHGVFCDYDPAADPTCFGFPEESERNRSG